MSLPATHLDPGVWFTGASRVLPDVRDLATSRWFHEQEIGLLLTGVQGSALRKAAAPRRHEIPL